MGEKNDDIDYDAPDIDGAVRFITDSEVMIWTAVRASHISPQERATLETALDKLDTFIRASKNSEAGYDALLAVMKIVNAMGTRGRQFEDSALATYKHRITSSKGGKNKPLPAWLTPLLPSINGYVSRHLLNYKQADIKRLVRKEIGQKAPDDRTIERGIARLINDRIIPAPKK